VRHFTSSYPRGVDGNTKEEKKSPNVYLSYRHLYEMTDSSYSVTIEVISAVFGIAVPEAALFLK
jgi:hypothetical protein